MIIRDEAELIREFAAYKSQFGPEWAGGVGVDVDLRAAPDRYPCLVEFWSYGTPGIFLTCGQPDGSQYRQASWGCGYDVSYPGQARWAAHFHHRLIDAVEDAVVWMPTSDIAQRFAALAKEARGC